MGLPAIVISFREAARTAVVRSQRGVVGLILRESVIPDTNPFVVSTEGDIPSGLTAANKLQIKNALKGYTQAAYQVHVYVIPALGSTYTTYTAVTPTITYTTVSNPTGNPSTSGYYEKNGDVYTLSTDTTVDEDKTYYTRTTDNPVTEGWYELSDGDYIASTDTAVDESKTYYEKETTTAPTEAEFDQYESALEYFVMKNVNYLAIPTVQTEGLASEVASWIKTLHADEKQNSPMIAVLPNCAADSEFIINYTTPSVTDSDGNIYTPELFCSRLAGLFATTPLTSSATYAELPEIEDCTFRKRAAIDAEIDAGQLVVFYDGEKYKIGRAVNSFTSVTLTKSKRYSKIRVIEIMMMIKADIAKNMEDNYIGKVTNSFDNKLLLAGEITNYFSLLTQEGALSSGTCDIDVDANRKWLKAEGYDIDGWTDAQIREALTEEQVFLQANIGLLDAMEDITIDIVF